MRRFGVMPYITPRQRATESSTVPKSVMKTTVGGYCEADGWAARKFPSSSNASRIRSVARQVGRICEGTTLMESSAPKSKSLKIRDRVHPTLTTVSAKKHLKSLNIVSGGRLKPKP